MSSWENRSRPNRLPGVEIHWLVRIFQRMTRTNSSNFAVLEVSSGFASLNQKCAKGKKRLRNSHFLTYLEDVERDRMNEILMKYFKMYKKFHCLEKIFPRSGGSMENLFVTRHIAPNRFLYLINTLNWIISFICPTGSQIPDYIIKNVKITIPKNNIFVPVPHPFPFLFLPCSSMSLSSIFSPSVFIQYFSPFRSLPLSHFATFIPHVLIAHPAPFFLSFHPIPVFSLLVPTSKSRHYFSFFALSLILPVISWFFDFFLACLCFCPFHFPFALNVSTSSLAYPFLWLFSFLFSILLVSCTPTFRPFCLQTLPFSFPLSLSAYSSGTLSSLCNLAFPCPLLAPLSNIFLAPLYLLLFVPLLLQKESTSAPQDLFIITNMTMKWWYFLWKHYFFYYNLLLCPHLQHNIPIWVFS
jgi:hypothetical protein